jgi:hypothetical protein
MHPSKGYNIHIAYIGGQDEHKVSGTDEMQVREARLAGAGADQSYIYRDRVEMAPDQQIPEMLKN